MPRSAVENGEQQEEVSARANPGVTNKPAPAPPPRRKKWRAIWIVLLVLAIAAIGIGFYYVRNVAPFESTDDAFIEAHVTLVAPRVGGLVEKVLVNDNQVVNAGDLLVQIDPRDFETALNQAKADVASAQARIEEARAQITVAAATAEQRNSAIRGAEAELRFAEAEAKRYESIGESGAVTRTQVETAQTRLQSATSNLQAARSFERAAQAQVGLARASSGSAEAQVLQAQAALAQAQLNLSYTKVTAPQAGRVTRRTVEPGAFVQAGQALLGLVPQDVWVVANFKETQIHTMRIGQPVSIRIDAFPGREFRGKIDSLQAGSGSRFSLLPPENAVGNYVKVVQRVPVKIVFTEKLDPNLNIGPGMSAEPKVRVK